jgi:glycosyltransferase involved in cell wall biosynthesis
MNGEAPRLAYVVNSLNPGGTERLVVEMSQAFSQEFIVEVICLDEPGAWAADLRADGVAVHCVWRQPGLDSSMPFKLANHFRRGRIDIVHAHQCTPWQYASLARLLCRRPRLLLEEHGRFYPEIDNPRRRWANRLVVRKLTHRFVAVSEDIRERLERYEGLERNEIRLVYNGVTPGVRLSTEERAALRRELGFKASDFVVGTVGRFDPIKNLDLLVHSLSRVSRQDATVRGLLVGDGQSFASIRTLVEQQGLASKVVLTGFRADARRLVQCLDLFVLSSLSEGTSMALLEAMAAGLPVAVTAVGGNPEIVEQGTTGWVVPSESVDALTGAIVDAVNDPHRRAAFGRAGAQRFAANFTFERMIGQYRDLYRELLATVPGPARGP